MKTAPKIPPMMCGYVLNATTRSKESMQLTQTYEDDVVINPVCMGCGMPVGKVWRKIQKLSRTNGSEFSEDVYTETFSQYGITNLCCRAFLMGTPKRTATEIRRVWRSC